MQIGLNRERKHAVRSALGLLLAIAIPHLSPTPAMAEPAKKADKHASAKVKETKGTKGRVALSKTKAAARLETNEDAPKGSKKTASRGSNKHGRRATDKCHTTTIAINRAGLEPQSLTLSDCAKKADTRSAVALSVLGRPWGAAKPKEPISTALSKGKSESIGLHHDGEIAPGVKLLDKGLLSRLNAIAHRFPGKPISLVSGYRPQSRGSLHQIGRALDLRVTGVSNEELVSFCRTLTDTGCGYYPNSSFVHMDVRKAGTGSIYWIDASGPGEAPQYVTQWPLPAERADVAVLHPTEERPDPIELDPKDEHAAHTASRTSSPDALSKAAPVAPAMTAVEGNRVSPIH